MIYCDREPFGDSAILLFPMEGRYEEDKDVSLVNLVSVFLFIKEYINRFKRIIVFSINYSYLSFVVPALSFYTIYMFWPLQMFGISILDTKVLLWCCYRSSKLHTT